MTTFYGDLETFSETPIRRGHYRYAEDCEVMVFSWAVDDGDVHVLDMTEPGHELELLEILAQMEQADEIVFHNSMFDRTVMRAKLPHMVPPLAKWRDSLVGALSHSMPGGMEKLCSILNVPYDQAKMADGKRLINLFCKPRPKTAKIRRATRETHPEEWALFLEYARHDILAMRVIWKKLPRWNYDGEQLELWHLDQQINDRGMLIDMDMVNAAERVIKRERKRLGEAAEEMTGGFLKSTTQRDKLLVYLLAEHGVDLPDLKKDTIKRRLEDENLPWQVKQLLENRQEAASASLAKFGTLKRSVCNDGRLRGTLQFNGAMRTGRWAGRLFQSQNLMRTPKRLTGKGSEGDRIVAEARAAIKEEFVDLVYDRPLEVLSASVPWAVVAPHGRKLVMSDLKNIEGRGLAWLAGEEWKLKAYYEQDTYPDDPTRDLYIISYSKAFGTPIPDVVAEVEAGGNWRQIGKVMELALGYGGAVGAFVSMAMVYGIDLNDLVKAIPHLPKHHYDDAARAWRRAEGEGNTFGLDRLVYIVCYAFSMMWREANPFIVAFWAQLRAAAIRAINNPGERFTVGKIQFRRQGPWLGMRLPSGGVLCYPHPKVENGQIYYRGINQYSRKWSWQKTYGGKLAENATQAIATGSRGIMGLSMPRIEAAGYEIIFHTHDEATTEAPDTADFTADGLGDILTAGFDWSKGLPLAAGGYESYFYRKD